MPFVKQRKPLSFSPEEMDRLNRSRRSRSEEKRKSCVPRSYWIL